MISYMYVHLWYDTRMLQYEKPVTMWQSSKASKTIIIHSSNRIQGCEYVQDHEHKHKPYHTLIEQCYIYILTRQTEEKRKREKKRLKEFLGEARSENESESAPMQNQMQDADQKKV